MVDVPDKEPLDVAEIEGPLGKASIYEIVRSDPVDGAATCVYEVRFDGQVETFPSLGEAYATAKTRAGVER